MKRGWFLVLILSLGLNVGLITAQFLDERAGEFSANGGPPERYRGGKRTANPDTVIARRLDIMTEALGLNREQRQRTEEIFHWIIPQTMVKREEVTAVRRTLLTHYGDPELDPDRIRALVSKLSAAQAQLDSLVAEALLEEATVLSPDQRAKYIELTPIARELGRRRKR